MSCVFLAVDSPDGWHRTTARQTALLLVPAASEVVDWATGEFDGLATPPVGVELDDDAEAIHRLLGYLDGGRRRTRLGGDADLTAR